MAATYYYDSFGNILEQTGEVSNSILYAGYQYDEETGLYYINARMYDPVTARFLQADTYLGNLNDPLSLNLYTYCLNNPHKYVDPSGHSVLLAFLLVTAVSGLLGAGMEYVSQKYIEKRDVINYDLILYEGVFNAVIGAASMGMANVGVAAARQAGKLTFRTIAKTVAKGVALGAVEGAIENVGRQMVTGASLSNLDYGEVASSAGFSGVIGGMGAAAGVGLDALKQTRVVRKMANGVKGKIADAANVLKGRNTGKYFRELDLQFFAGDEVYESGMYLADFDDLANYRRQQGMPIAGSVEDKHTAAKLVIGDNVYYGKNGHGKQKKVASVFTVNPQTATHAEGDVFYQAKMAGNTNATAILVTDRCACRACGFNGGIRSLAKQMGITDLTIVSPSHNPIRINPQVKPDPNPFK